MACWIGHPGHIVILLLVEHQHYHADGGRGPRHAVMPSVDQTCSDGIKDAGIVMKHAD